MDKLHTASDCIVHARSTRQPFCLCVGHEQGAAAWAPRVLQWRRARMRGTAARKEPRRQRVRLPRITRTAVAPAHARAPRRATPGACARLLRRLRSQLLRNQRRRAGLGRGGREAGQQQRARAQAQRVHRCHQLVRRRDRLQRLLPQPPPKAPDIAMVRTRGLTNHRIRGELPSCSTCRSPRRPLRRAQQARARCALLAPPKAEHLPKQRGAPATAARGQRARTSKRWCTSGSTRSGAQ